MALMDRETFISDMLRAYLRKLQKTEGLAVTGAFKSHGGWYSWGAVGEYGDPPVGSFVLEVSPNGTEWASFRFWHARRRDDESVYRGKALMYDEVSEPREQADRGSST